MPDIRDVLNSRFDDEAQLNTVRLGEDPTRLICFTTEYEEVVLHFERDPSVNNFVVCPGSDCPNCELGERADRAWLLPVLDVMTGKVSVLRIPQRRGLGTLRSCLTPHLHAPSLHEKVLVIRKSKLNHHSVESRPRNEIAGADETIEEFEKRRSAGLQLASAFWSPSVEELRQVERVQRGLAAIAPPAPLEEKRSSRAKKSGAGKVQGARSIRESDRAGAAGDKQGRASEEHALHEGSLVDEDDEDDDMDEDD